MKVPYQNIMIDIPECGHFYKTCFACSLNEKTFPDGNFRHEAWMGTDLVGYEKHMCESCYMQVESCLNGLVLDILLAL